MSFRSRNVVSNMFSAVAFAMIFTQVTGVLAPIIDGIITSRLVGYVSYSAVALLGPFIGAVLLMAASFAAGSQIICSKAIGRGERDKANAAFTYSVLGALFISVFVLFACLFFPAFLLRICGVSVNSRQNLYPLMLRYLHGFMPGIPFMMLIQVMGPIVVLDGGRRCFNISTIAFAVTDIAADIVNVLVFNGGVFGIAVSSSVSFFIQFLILMMHFVGKRSYFSLSFKGINRAIISEVGSAGNPTSVRKTFNILKDLTLNRINLYVAVSATAIAARGTQSDLNSLFLCLGAGIGNALMAMTSIYYGVEDRQGLKRLFSYSMGFAFSISFVTGLVLFIIAPLLSFSYTSDPDVIVLTVFGIRCLALSIPLDTLAVSFQSYLQGSMRNKKLVNGMSFFERFLIPVMSAVFMARYFGSKGVLASLIVSKFLQIIVMLILILVKNRHIPRSIYDWMLIPSTFGGSDNENLYVSLSTMDDVVKGCDAAEQFCLNHGIEPKRALFAALFIEEMGGNIVIHGKRRANSRIVADFRMFIRDGRISISIQDYCKQFDPLAYFATHKDEAGALGIKLVKNLSSEFRYFNAFNSNNIMIVLDDSNSSSESEEVTD